MYYKTEQEIMQNWRRDITLPVVSICCITYNHENYIIEALNSFLMQKTDFPFEILINDDCSTDKTAKIIKEYEIKYPNIIKSLYQTENQYSKGNIKMNPTFNFPRALGKYFALCEGDDYWTDPLKLKIQILEMIKFPECDMSFHPAKELINSNIGRTISQHNNNNKVFTTSEVILGDGDFCPTASLLFRRRFVMRLPDFFYETNSAGDYLMQIFSSLNGGALYINQVMSVYRRGHPEAWSSVDFQLSMKKTIEKTEKRTFNSIETLKILNKYLKYKYKEEINIKISERYFRLSLTYLENNLIEKFDVAITDSYRLNKHSSIIKIFYLGKRLPYILKFFYTNRSLLKGGKLSHTNEV